MPDDSGGLPIKVYDDLAGPTIREIGSVVQRTVRAALWPARKRLLEWEKAEELATREVERRFKELGVPEESLVEPPPELVLGVVAALQIAHSSDELRTVFANLLAATMNPETTDEVHPAFLEIARQITPDEARLLAAVDPVSPLELSKTTVERGDRPVPAYWYTQLPEKQLDLHRPHALSLYVTNLERLGLVELRELNPAVRSEGFAKDASRAILNRSWSGRFAISLTALGMRFWRACVYQPSIPDRT